MTLWALAAALCASTAMAEALADCTAGSADYYEQAYSESVTTWATDVPSMVGAFSVAVSPDGGLVAVSDETVGLYVLDWAGNVVAFDSSESLYYLSNLFWNELGIFGGSKTGLQFSAWSAANATLDFAQLYPFPGYPEIAQLSTGDYVVALQAEWAAMPTCQIVRVPESLDFDAASCLSDAVGGWPRGVTVLDDDVIAVASGTSTASYIMLLADNTTTAVVWSGQPLVYPTAIVQGSAAWGEFADLLVVNYDFWADSKGVVVGVDVGAADARVVAASASLAFAQGAVLNASNDALVVAAGSGLVVALPCVPVDVDDDDGDGGGGGDGFPWADVAGGAVVAGLLGYAALTAHRRWGRGAPQPESDLERRLLDDVVDSALVLKRERWVIDPAWLARQGIIGGGANGQVFRGQFQGAAVAIKALPCDMSEASLGSVAREAKLAVSMMHPFVLRCLGVAVDADNYEVLVVTELCEGNLQELIDDADGRALGHAERVRLALQIAQAFEYLHENRVLHRDLKPANVLLHADGNVRVSDFGESRAVTSQQTFSATAMAGTPGYMAPEAISGGAHVGAAADVYSFGVLLNALATRRPPVPAAAGTMHDVLARVVRGERPPLCTAGEDAPEWYVDLVERCWDHEPRRRPLFPEIVRELAGRQSESSSASTSGGGRGSLSMSRAG